MSREIIFFDSANRVGSVNSPLIRVLEGETYRGLWLFLSITASDGTSELMDIQIQRQDPASEIWVDIPGAAFVQLTSGTGVAEMLIHPSMTAAAAVVIKEPAGGAMRAEMVLGGTSPEFTFSLGGLLLN